MITLEMAIAKIKKLPAEQLNETGVLGFIVSAVAQSLAQKSNESYVLMGLLTIV